MNYKVFASKFLIVYLLAARLFSSCEVSVFDCGQGNVVATRYNKQTMLFDAGRTSYSKFVEFEDDRSGESLTDQVFNIELLNKNDENSKLLTAKVDDKNYAVKWKEDNKYVYKDDFNLILQEYLTGEGHHLKTVFISHPDKDHYSLVYEALLQPQLLILAGNDGSYNKDIKTYITRNKIRFLFSKNKGLLSDAKGKVLNDEEYKESILFKGINENSENPTLTILSVNAGGGTKKTKNKDSMVIKLKQNKSFLITGDAEKETWSNIEQASLSSDILLVPHHGSMTNGSTTKDIIEKIKPKVCLISAGFQHHHPQAAVIDILLKYFKNNYYRTLPHFVTYHNGKKRFSIITNAPIFTTIDNGTLKFDLSSENLKITVARDFYPSPQTFLKRNVAFEHLPSRKVSSCAALYSFNNNSAPISLEQYFGVNTYYVKNEKSATEDVTYKYYYKVASDTYLEMKLKDADNKIIEDFPGWLKGQKQEDLESIALSFKGATRLKEPLKVNSDESEESEEMADDASESEDNLIFD